MTNNVFRLLNGTIDRIEKVDTTFADLDYGRMRNVTFAGNTFTGVAEEVRNPLSMTHAQTTPSRAWLCDPGTWLPFRGRARAVEGVTPVGRIASAADAAVYESPWVEVEYGTARRQFRANFLTPCTGTIRASVRMDNPQ